MIKNCNCNDTVFNAGDQVVLVGTKHPIMVVEDVIKFDCCKEEYQKQLLTAKDGRLRDCYVKSDCCDLIIYKVVYYHEGSGQFVGESFREEVLEDAPCE